MGCESSSGKVLIGKCCAPGEFEISRISATSVLIAHSINTNFDPTPPPSPQALADQWDIAEQWVNARHQDVSALPNFGSSITSVLSYRRDAGFSNFRNHDYIPTFADLDAFSSASVCFENANPALNVFVPVSYIENDDRQSASNPLDFITETTVGKASYLFPSNVEDTYEERQVSLDTSLPNPTSPATGCSNPWQDFTTGGFISENSISGTVLHYPIPTIGALRSFYCNQALANPTFRKGNGSRTISPKLESLINPAP